MSLIDDMNKSLTKVMKDGEESFIEFAQSEIHECKMAKSNENIFFITPDFKMKFVPNIHHVFSFPISKEVKCCMWCGFSPNKTNKHYQT